MSVISRAWSRARPWLVVCAISIGPTTARSSSGGEPNAERTTEGRLLANHDGGKIDVPLEHTDVRIRVDGFLAEATVTQRFRNPYPTKIEAIYLFPLPTNAAVSELEIVTGGRTIRGAIAERAKATRVYEAARAKGQVAALLTQERPNLFTQAIANLEPAATIDVTLHYVQRLDYDHGGYEVVFPMVAGPRYTPAAPAAAKRDGATAAAAAVQPTVLPAGLRSAHDISLTVELAAGVAIEDLSSPSHRIAVKRGDPTHATVAIDAGDTIPNKDFILRYQVSGATTKFGALAYRPSGAPGSSEGQGSFVLIAQPPAAVAPAEVTARELVFVLDTSSSMRGAPLTKAKELIRKLLVDLRPDDTFQIVRFDDRASALGPAPIANKPRNIALTLDWLARLDAGGTTEMTSGIAAALAVPHDPQRLRVVAFITDGYVGNEDEILATVGRTAGAARLFAFGVGTAVNRYLLEEMAAAGRGVAQVVRPDEDSAKAIAAFEARVDAPVLTDVAIDWGGLAVSDVTPRALPDLFVGQPLALAGHYARAGRGVVTITGHQAGRDVRFEVPVTLPERADDHPAIATVWARQRITELSRQLIRKADPAIEREIVALSIAHRVLTQFTAFVAVDTSRTTAGGDAKRVVVPVEVPDAVAGIGEANGGYGYGISGYGTGGGGAGYGVIGIGSYASVGHGYASATSAGILGSSSIGDGYGAGGGGLGVHHVTSVPTVTIGSPVMAGDLDKSVIRRYVKRHLEQIRYCYEKRLLAVPTLAGTVHVRFVIDDGGVVVASAATGLGDKDVERCVADAVRDIEFPKAIGGGTVEVNYPFTFHPAESAKSQEQP